MALMAPDATRPIICIWFYTAAERCDQKRPESLEDAHVQNSADRP
jgi:hypothetical protein